MDAAASISSDTGLEVVDLWSDASFAARPLRPRDAVAQMEAMQSIARAFVESLDTIPDALVRSAVELCGADSAGISIEREGRTEGEFYHWVATAGEYNGFLHAVLPRYPSACGICLERGTPQIFRVSQRFFDILGVKAPLVTDGILLPWQMDQMRGTIFIMAHGRTEAFDRNDCRMMQILADFAALGARQKKQHERLREQASLAAAAAMANDLAHRINNPLQSLTNILYLAEHGYSGEGARELGRQAAGDLQRLSGLVEGLLTLPFQNTRKPVDPRTSTSDMAGEASGPTTH